MHLLILLMIRVLFTFLLKLNSHHPYTFTPHLQQTLKQNHRALHNFYRVKNMLKLLAFKWPLNKLLLEKEWSEFMLIWWFVSIRFIKSFLKFSWLISLFKQFSFTEKTVHFPSTDIIMVALLCFSSAFFALLFFLNKIVKPRCKIPRVNCLKVVFTIFFYYKVFKNKRLFQKYVPSKKNEKLHRLWWSLYKLYKPISRPSNYIFLH